MDNEGASRRQCSATTRKGARCRTRALPGRDHCGLHSPEAVEGRRLGGVNRSNAHRATIRLPPDLRAVADMLAEGIEQTRDGAMKPQVLTAMAAGTTALLRVVELALLAAQLDEMKRQIAEIQAQRTIEAGFYR